VTKLYAKADERIRRVFPDVSTSGAYTIFLSIDTALSVAGPFLHSGLTIPCKGGEVDSKGVWISGGVGAGKDWTCLNAVEGDWC
jgi:hypothetical protein